MASKWSETAAERRTASELVREVKPRGMSTDRAREAHRLREVEGLGLDEIASRLGVDRKTVVRYVSQVRQEKRGW